VRFATIRMISRFAIRLTRYGRSCVQKVYCSLSGATYRMENLCVCFNLYCSLMHTYSVTTTEVEGAQD